MDSFATIDAIILSVGEPQLENCLKSVYNQTVPFTNVIHIKDVYPEAKAFTFGMEQANSTWIVYIGGDFILYENANEIIQWHIQNEEKQNVAQYHFGIYDTFLKRVINACQVFRTDIMKQIGGIANKMSDRSPQVCEKMGMINRRLWRTNPPVVVATHFDNPDEFQVFRRFYKAGLKRTRPCRDILVNLCDKNGDNRYPLAIKAYDYGLTRAFNDYPGSYNIEYDRQVYDSFKQEGNV